MTGIELGVFQELNGYIDCNYTSLYLYLKHGKQRKIHEQPSSVKLGRPRALLYQAELFLVLIKLRHGLKDDLLAILFELSSKSPVSSIFTTWVPHLAHELGPLLRWPSVEAVQRHLPDIFKRYITNRKCRVILDCFEAQVEKPSSFSANSMMYSNYKSRTTYKVLTGVTPDGYISFVSDAYPGSISDPAIVRESKVLEKLQAGDGIMADKGFTLTATDLQPRGLHLVLPPFKTGNLPMKKNEVQQTKEIANRRIVVENAIGRMRHYDILNTVLPASVLQSQIVSDMVKVVAILANFQSALR